MIRFIELVFQEKPSDIHIRTYAFSHRQLGCAIAVVESVCAVVNDVCESHYRRSYRVYVVTLLGGVFFRTTVVLHT